MGLRLLVCGGRDYNDYVLIYDTLDAIRATRGEVSVLIEGGAKGADNWGASWAWMNRETVEHLKFKADWKSNGKKAGPMRNQRMIDEGKPDLVVAFPGGRGTADMVTRAKASGVEVIKIHGRVKAAAMGDLCTP